MDRAIYYCKKVSDLVYWIRKSSGSDIKYVHHDRLKPARVQTSNWLSSAGDAEGGGSTGQNGGDINLDETDETSSFSGSGEDDTAIVTGYSDRMLTSQASGNVLDPDGKTLGSPVDDSNPAEIVGSGDSGSAEIVGSDDSDGKTSESPVDNSNSTEIIVGSDEAQNAESKMDGLFTDKPTTRSGRRVKPPAYLKDFDCQL